MRVALVHDYLTQFGGAEQVLSVLASHFPDAHVLTSIATPDLDLPEIHRDRIVQSMLGRIPAFRANHRLATPLYPLAMRNLGRQLDDIDIIIADSSAWAHHVVPRTDQRLIVYCHSPARFLYGDPHYLGAISIRGSRARVLHGVAAPYRWLDRRAWRRADLVLANSGVVARRLADAVGIEAQVVYPPVDTEYFRPVAAVPRGDSLLVVSRLVPHKWIDLAVRTATSFNLPLTVIGEGRDRARLHALAGPTVQFLDFQSRASVRDHLQRCRAFILPGAEDFGMTAVEAQASGAPVIAFGQGGATETVIDGRTGVLFAEQTESALMDAIERLNTIGIDPEECVANASRFGITPFLDAIDAAVEQVSGKGSPGRPVGKLQP